MSAEEEDAQDTSSRQSPILGSGYRPSSLGGTDPPSSGAGLAELLQFSGQLFQHQLDQTKPSPSAGAFPPRALGWQQVLGAHRAPRSQPPILPTLSERKPYAEKVRSSYSARQT